MPQYVWDVLVGTAELIAGSVPSLVGLGFGFALVSAWATPCNPGLPWWRKPDLVTDLCYFFMLPFVARAAMLVFALMAAGVISTLTGEATLTGALGPIPGPFSDLSFGWQVVIYLALFDLMLYWSHRAFHTASLWRYHAVHHAPEHLDWISARRFHPVDTALHSVLPDFILLMLGIPAEVVLLLAPFNICHSALVHANLDWTFGPFKYVLAGPVFHRWHHTDVARGGSKNFAATFPVFDLAFGTFYMPEGVLPDGYGVDDEHFPSTVRGQLAYPFARLSPTGQAGARPVQAQSSRPELSRARSGETDRRAAIDGPMDEKVLGPAS